MEAFENKVIASVKKELETLPALSSECFIYRVPENLRKVNEDAYKPLLVSIGAFWYGDARLVAMQEHKLRYLHCFLQRNGTDNVVVDSSPSTLSDQCLKRAGGYIKHIIRLESAVRQCYVGALDISSEEFVKMILIDAAFIIELFRRADCGQEIDINDRIFNKPRVIVEVKRDLRLEENQLPFFILQSLYHSAFGQSPQKSFVDLTYNFLTERKEPAPKSAADAGNSIKHLVDFSRLYHLPSKCRVENTTRNHTSELSEIKVDASSKEDPSGSQTVMSSHGEIEQSEAGSKHTSGNHNPELSDSKIDTSSKEDLSGNRPRLFCPTVTELREAGVEFEVSKKEKLLDITFEKGVLKIPRLVVTDDTESLFRNIMLFEQCHYYSDSYIIDYFAFLDALIDTPGDVERLARYGIIENWLGSNEEAANLFNKIFKQTRLRADKFHYSGICRELNTYTRTRCNRWRAILSRKYFNHPWAVISVIYAIVILALTAIQAGTSFKK